MADVVAILMTMKRLVVTRNLSKEFGSHGHSAYMSKCWMIRASMSCINHAIDNQQWNNTPRSTPRKISSPKSNAAKGSDFLGGAALRRMFLLLLLLQTGFKRPFRRISKSISIMPPTPASQKASAAFYSRAPRQWSKHSALHCCTWDPGTEMRDWHA